MIVAEPAKQVKRVAGLGVIGVYIQLPIGVRKSKICIVRLDGLHGVGDNQAYEPEGTHSAEGGKRRAARRGEKEYVALGVAAAARAIQ